MSQADTLGTERVLRHDDPALGQRWLLAVTVTSEKDASWRLPGGSG